MELGFLMVQECKVRGMEQNNKKTTDQSIFSFRKKTKTS